MTTKVMKFKPDSVAVTTGSVVVSSNEWWRIGYEIDDGSLAYEGATFATGSKVDAANTVGTGNVKLSIPAATFFKGSAHCSNTSGAAGDLYLSGSHYLSMGNNNLSVNFEVLGPTTINLTNSSAIVSIIGTRRNDTAIGTSRGFVWLPEDTTLTGSGNFKLWIEKYS